MPYTRAHASIETFVSTWQASGGAERANYQMFLSELCDQLSVTRPDPTKPDDTENAYVFERTVTLQHGDGNTSPNYIDLYKRGCFILEAKQGSDKAEKPLSPELAKKLKTGTAKRGTKGWDKAMLAARYQAERYAKALPMDEGWPPFLLIVDVGHSIEIYSEFSCTGKTYLPFPDPQSHRIPLDSLTKPEVQDLLRQVWMDPLSLDPSKRSAKVTREVADRLARLAKSLESSGYSAEKVGNFLKRCLFTMFAEDIALIPKDSFTKLLESLRGHAENYAPMAESLWQTMKDGGFSPVLREKLLRFNGGLFEDAEAIPLSEDQLELLILAGKADWQDVEPAIFGTLLERALDPTERHHLGAHYTPREYVERLVLPTVVEPLRADWEAVLTAAVSLEDQGKNDEAIGQIKEFHHHLCNVRVLDPACGSGNFLYVTFEHLKRLEGEILDALEGFGESQALLGLEGTTVDPHQLLGIEVNPRAAAITDMVLWIGYLQWHYRTRGNVQPPEPVIKKFRNIECRDAVLDWDHTEPTLNEDGSPATHWDGITTKTHPITGEQVPDETAQVSMLHYVNPREAIWPDVDFVVGNPPYLGARTIRPALGDGYLAALRETYVEVPDHVDYVMYWWEKAAKLVGADQIRRFGLITTNSISQEFSRKVIQRHFQTNEGFRFHSVIHNHPWVDTVDGANVRVTLTVCDKAQGEGQLFKITRETPSENGEITISLSPSNGIIGPDLRLGANLLSTSELISNNGLSSVGYQLTGKGFTLDASIGIRLDPAFGTELSAIWPLLSGRDITQKSRNLLTIDVCDLSLQELQTNHPSIYQWLYERVKPERDLNNRESVRKKWWIYGEARKTFRPALKNIRRFIVTSLTSKFRFFTFADVKAIPDSTTVIFAFEDAFTLGILSSHIHLNWVLASGGTLEDRPRYNKARCFDPFPFPECSEQQKDHIGQLAEALDYHRKHQQKLHPGLTMTAMYNVLEKLRCGDVLTVKEKQTHEDGLVEVLRQQHDDLNIAVADAYGWAADLPDDVILEKLVALNSERIKEEEKGLFRWLRPEYQNPQGTQDQAQGKLLETETKPTTTVAKQKQSWPKTLPEQVAAVRSALAKQDGPVTAKQLKENFKHAREAKVQELLSALASIGQAHEVESGAYVA